MTELPKPYMYFEVEKTKDREAAEIVLFNRKGKVTIVQRPRERKR